MFGYITQNCIKFRQVISEAKREEECRLLIVFLLHIL